MAEKELSPDLIVRDLNTRFIGQRVLYYSTLDSTMNAAQREAKWGAEAGTIVITDEQTAGRGRLRRSWLSPKGGLAFSIILRPNIDYLPYMIMLSALAVSQSIQEITGLKTQIKWPNDVLVKEKKVAGILIENDIRQNILKYTIIGIGINVNLHIPDYAEIASIATSLSDETGKEVSRLEILRQVLIETERLYLLLPRNDIIQEKWKERLVTLGQKVQVNLGDRICYGVAESVARDGSLLLRQSDGSTLRISVGDVSVY
jgi:BirA family transcriptional regulator, biotin operon repressor / biotin---[acetyl-CoA-carboxylase] ligase